MTTIETLTYATDNQHRYHHFVNWPRYRTWLMTKARLEGHDWVTIGRAAGTTRFGAWRTCRRRLMSQGMRASFHVQDLALRDVAHALLGAPARLGDSK